MTTTIPISHVQWQQQCVDLAHTLGYSHLHVRRTVGRGKKWVTATNRIGWPDLLCFGPGGRGFVGLELKVGRDKATSEQLEVLAELEAAGARTMVAWPSDLDAVVALLTVPRNRWVA